MVDVYKLIELGTSSLYFILPAYVANATPVILGGGCPLDLNHKFIDGRPIFGRNKTIRGFLSGLIVGSSVGILQERAIIGFLLSLGALLGDLMTSFIKRRLAIPPGGSFIPFDQLGFLIGALALSSFLIVLSLEQILFLFIVTFFLHIGTNAMYSRFRKLVRLDCMKAWYGKAVLVLSRKLKYSSVLT